MTRASNPYENLRIDCLADVDPVEAQSIWVVTDGRDEKVTVLTALLPDGFWVYGYNVRWARGRLSEHRPSAALGRFRSQREAKLYALGFFKIYSHAFINSTMDAICRAENLLLQDSLF